MQTSLKEKRKQGGSDFGRGKGFRSFFWSGLLVAGMMTGITALKPEVSNASVFPRPLETFSRGPEDGRNQSHRFYADSYIGSLRKAEREIAREREEAEKLRKKQEERTNWGYKVKSFSKTVFKIAFYAGCGVLALGALTTLMFLSACLDEWLKKPRRRNGAGLTGLEIGLELARKSNETSRTAFWQANEEAAAQRAQAEAASKSAPRRTEVEHEPYHPDQDIGSNAFPDHGEPWDSSKGYPHPDQDIGSGAFSDAEPWDSSKDGRHPDQDIGSGATADDSSEY